MPVRAALVHTVVVLSALPSRVHAVSLLTGIAPRSTVLAPAARVQNPLDADAAPKLHIIALARPGRNSDDDAYALMAADERQRALHPLAAFDVQVGVTDSGACQLDQDLARL